MAIKKVNAGVSGGEASYNEEHQEMEAFTSDFKNGVKDLKKNNASFTPRRIVERLNNVAAQTGGVVNKVSEDTPILIRTRDGIYLLGSLATTDIVVVCEDTNERSEPKEYIIVGCEDSPRIIAIGDPTRNTFDIDSLLGIDKQKGDGDNEN